MELVAGGAGLERAGQVEALVFGTTSRVEIDELIHRFCADRLDAGVDRVLDRATSVGMVTAVQLTDGRRLLLKAHQPRESRQRLRAVHDLQTRLYRAGFPCPEPVLGPIAIGRGHMTVETLLDDGEYRDTLDPSSRRLIAEALAWHLQITAGSDPPAELTGGWSLCELIGYGHSTRTHRSLTLRRPVKRICPCGGEAVVGC